MADPLDWSEDELGLLLRSRAPIVTRTPGLAGVLSELRADGFVAVQLPWAVAYLHRSALIPPPRYAVGARVSTPFGRGVIREGLRTQGAGGVGYEVTLLDCALADGGRAVGFLTSTSVTRRDPEDLLFDEILADADVLRLSGNAAFKARDFQAAVDEYRRVVDKFQLTRGKLVKREADAMREAVVKAWSNASQACVNMGDSQSLVAAIRFTTEALSIDSGDATGQRGKLLYRRALAHTGLGNHDEALKDLSDPVLAATPDAITKAKDVRALMRRKDESDRKFWSSAVKSAASPTAAAAEGAEGGSSSVRFVSPNKDDAAAAQSPSSTERSGLRGSRGTPHPSKRGGLGATAGADDDDEEGGAGGGRLSPSPAKGGLSRSQIAPFSTSGGEGGSVTVEEEVEEPTAEEGTSIWPYYAAGAAVVSVLAVVGFSLLRRK